jgi:choline dehydrogenase
LFERDRNQFTWAVLKAYTENNAGRVTLKSKDPTKWPRIDFHYFSEGSDKQEADLDAVVDGVQFVRQMNKALGSVKEIAPGPECDTPERLRQFIQDEAWGHHASCTCKIGADSDPMAVLDSRFRVRKTQGLRVVDASVFPKIPGYFIVSAIYMISEKAADVIIEDARLIPTAALAR